jgi:hypothetical protein
LKTGMLLIFGKQMSVLFGLKLLFSKDSKKSPILINSFGFVFNAYDIFAGITCL